MNWKELYTWEKGAWVGFFIWLGLLVLAFFKYYYSRYYVEGMGSDIKPFLFFNYPNLFVLSLYGLVIIVLAGLIGHLIEKRMKH